MSRHRALVPDSLLLVGILLGLLVGLGAIGLGLVLGALGIITI